MASSGVSRSASCASAAAVSGAPRLRDRSAARSSMSARSRSGSSAARARWPASSSNPPATAPALRCASRRAPGGDRATTPAAKRGWAKCSSSEASTLVSTPASTAASSPPTTCPTRSSDGPRDSGDRRMVHDGGALESQIDAARAQAQAEQVEVDRLQRQVEDLARVRRRRDLDGRSGTRERGGDAHVVLRDAAALETALQRADGVELAPAVREALDRVGALELLAVLRGAGHLDRLRERRGAGLRSSRAGAADKHDGERGYRSGEQPFETWTWDSLQEVGGPTRSSRNPLDRNPVRCGGTSACRHAPEPGPSMNGGRWAIDGPDRRPPRDRFRVDHLTLASSRPDDQPAAGGRGRPARRAHGHAQPQREAAGARQRPLRLRVERDAQA